MSYNSKNNLSRKRVSQSIKGHLKSNNVRIIRQRNNPESYVVFVEGSQTPTCMIGVKKKLHKAGFRTTTITRSKNVSAKKSMRRYSDSRHQLCVIQAVAAPNAPKDPPGFKNPNGKPKKKQK